MIVLRSPKGWTGQKQIDGPQAEDRGVRTVPLTDVRKDPVHWQQLESWLQSYRRRSCSMPTARCGRSCTAHPGG